MGNLNFESFQILLFLIPGFISIWLIDLLIAREKKSAFDKIIESLILSFLIYLVAAFFSKKFPVSLEVVADNQGSKFYSLHYDNTSFLIVAVISLVIALIISVAYNHDWVMGILRKLKITKRTSRISVWNDVFIDKDKHIIINFSNGRRIYGWPEYFSEDPEKPFIYLHDPSWIDNDKFVDLGIDGMLITNKQDIESIEFLRD